MTGGSVFFFFSSRRRHTRCSRDWSSDVCSSDLVGVRELIRVRTEKNAGRQIFAPIDYDKVLPVMGGMSGADISVILRRTLEAKVHAVAAGAPPSLPTTANVLDAIRGAKGVRGVGGKRR